MDIFPPTIHYPLPAACCNGWCTLQRVVFKEETVAVYGMQVSMIPE
ncbi:hypothetical protein [Desulfogranum marinum]|nr:hypothetical protein [Desulfogranum marinum]